mgnify:CR=1 FL=1
MHFYSHANEYKNLTQPVQNAHKATGARGKDEIDLHKSNIKIMVKWPQIFSLLKLLK